MHYELYLPFPPTVNSYYSKTKRGVYISHNGRSFRDKTAEAIAEQIGLAEPITDKMLVEVVLYVPDKRLRDLDNYMKGLLDSITKASLWEDDSLIEQLFIYRGAVTRGGSTFVRITDAGPVMPLGVAPPTD